MDTQEIEHKDTSHCQNTLWKSVLVGQSGDLYVLSHPCKLLVEDRDLLHPGSQTHSSILQSALTHGKLRNGLGQKILVFFKHNAIPIVIAE